ncbi:putative amidoligase enzyme-domain-containing protein [Xylariaceae sp. AK1471]|nr:putative amidoligase enzyme-domain-containing protein [Xylariaceae sp. AK1471]
MACIPKIDEMIEAPDDSEGTLTCGVELEFLVPSINWRAPDPDPDVDQYVCRSVLSSQGDITGEVRDQVLETLQQIDDVPFSLSNDDAFYPPHENVVIYDSWRLGRDGSVSKHGDVGLAEGPYHWTSCELSSVVMGPDEYSKQIEDVCRVLRSFRIHLNESTSVHVHIGRGDEPFSLLTVKKFSTLYWLTEKAILELHHPSRQNNKFSFHLTKCSVLASKSQATLDRDEQGLNDEGLLTMDDYVPKTGLTEFRYSQLRRIWGCKNIEERFLPAGKSGGNIQTFEWRQMSGSLDADHINQWVKFCMTFTNFCRLSDKPTFNKFAETVIQKGEDYTGMELLKALNINIQIFEHMLTVWSENPGFCKDNKGKELFVPR